MNSYEYNLLLRACQDRIGCMIDGKYRLEELMGVGSAGAVYRATNTWVGREYALKLFHPGPSQTDHALQRFIREAQVSNRIRKNGRPHPNVVDALDVGRDPNSGLFFSVQEFLVGETLESRMEKLPEHRMEVGEAVHLILPVVDALAAAHEVGVVHRDLKPDNIYLLHTEMGDVPKILDFGIAQLRDDRMTASHELMGTPLYMAPEAFFGASKVDARADVWAVGVILYQLIAGELPFPDAANNISLGALIAMVATAEIRSLAERGLMSANAWRVLDHCLRRDPATRYAHAGELRAGLHDVFEVV